MTGGRAIGGRQVRSGDLRGCRTRERKLAVVWKTDVLVRTGDLTTVVPVRLL